MKPNFLKVETDRYTFIYTKGEGIRVFKGNKEQKFQEEHILHLMKTVNDLDEQLQRMQLQ